MKDKHVFAIFFGIFAGITLSASMLLCLLRGFNLELCMFGGIGLAGAVLAAYFVRQAERFNL